MAANNNGFASSLDPRLLCQSCFSMLENQGFCENCVGNITDNGDSILSVELQRFCKHKNRGCKWSGQLGVLEEHLKDCLYVETTCLNEGCNVRMMKRLRGKHMVNECRFKKLPQPLVEVGGDQMGSDHHARMMSYIAETL